MLAILTGFLTGFIHVVSGPDHLAAVAPLAVRSHRDSWRTGLRWGLGHSTGVALVGVVAFAARGLLPLDRISAVSERLVGIVLLGVGCWALREALRVQVHAHPHVHDGEAHEHLHFHSHTQNHAPALDPVADPLPRHRHTHAALGIGTLHGLAGSSHLVAILPTLALPDWQQALMYLMSFGLGTVAAMAGFSAGLGWVAGRLRLSPLPAYRVLLGSSAALALGVGGWWIWQPG
jgi:hypothetical protein